MHTRSRWKISGSRPLAEEWVCVFLSAFPRNAANDAQFLVSVISSVVIVLLAIQETKHYLAGDVVEQLYVDSTSSDVRLNVHFDITFHRLPCACEFI
ncbi:hypothetical protein Y032_0277g1123 [Ancylostoma ceylanicum]|uniref:Endoplasmic reticulum vesicle transporter N-terminal domain-containing protein n=1 Tax=Ancylostoma ceylanicum TaxID=53326 RepID=A0A016S7Z7_9BILA|nr:hypothetical protein Y032_0277g1123 [Ancylostoma ceylanicum]